MSPPATAKVANPFADDAPASPSPAAPPPASGDSPGYQAALAEARKIYAQPGETSSLALTSGALLGAGPQLDSTIAGIETSVNNLIGAAQGKHPKYTSDEAARAVKVASKEALAKFGKDHPVGAFAEDFAGSLLTPGIGLANKAMKLKGIPALWRSVSVGGVIGGGRGFFDSDGKPTGERSKETALSAAGGAVVGGVLHQAGHLAGEALERAKPALAGVLGTVKNKLSSHAEEGPEAIAKRQAEGRKVGAEIVKKRVAANPQGATLGRSPAELAGKDVTAAEHLGRHDVARLGSAARHEGEAGDAMIARIQARQDEASSRIATRVAEVAGLDSDAIEGDFEETNRKLREKAKPLYDEWHSHTDVDSEELGKVRETPAFQKAMKKAAEIISNEHGNAVEEGLAPDELPLEWNGKPMIDRSTGKPMMVPREQALSHAASSGTPHSMAGEIEKPPIPTAKGYDYVKRGFDALINEHKDPVTKRIDYANADVKALVKLRSELNAALTDETKPWGKAAKAAYAAGGEAPMQEEAFHAAKDIMSASMSDHDFEKRISRFTPSQMDALKAGLANLFRDSARGKGIKVENFLNPNAEMKIRRIFGQHAGDAILRDMRTELEMSRSGKQLLRKPIESAKDQDHDIERHAAEWYHFAMAGERLKNLNLPMAALHAMRGVMMHGAKWMETPEGKAANDELVRLLSMRPSELEAELAKSGVKAADMPKAKTLFDKLRESPLFDNLSGKTGGIISGDVTGLYNDTYGKKSDEKTPSKPEGKVQNPFLDDADPSDPKATKASYDKPPSPGASNEEVSGYLENTLGVPVTITSGFRSEAHNRAVGGVEGSAHTEGEAWDFQPHGMSMEDAGFRLAHSGIPFDQIEITPDHVHVSFDPKMRGMVIYHGFGGRSPAPDTGDADMIAGLNPDLGDGM